jgi:hypothetical protein
MPMLPQPPASHFLSAAAAEEATASKNGDTTNYNIKEIDMTEFRDLRYDDRSEKYGQTPGLTMPGGFFVFASTMKLAWRAVHENWANIDWTRRQSAETMIGSDAWQLQVDGAKRALGRCIAFFVKHNMLPLPLALAVTRRGKPYRGGKRLYVLAQPKDAETVMAMEMPTIRAARNRELLVHVDWAALQQHNNQTIGVHCYANH